MGTLGEELTLTETAMNVAESVLDEDCSSMECDEGTSSWDSYDAQWRSNYVHQLAAAADEIFGAELALTETAMNVAEAAMKMDEDEDYFDDEQPAGYNSDDPMYQTDYDSQGSY